MSASQTEPQESSPRQNNLVLTVLPFLAIAFSLCYICIPHLAYEAWYDEAYTLEYFATGKMHDAFCDYRAPNNHILFSAALGLWRILLKDSANVFTLRLLPLCAFLLSVGLLFLAVRKLADKKTAYLAACIFATSHVALNFATQLRGYGPSCFFVILAFLAATKLVKKGLSKPWLALLCLSAVISVGIIPTNLIILGIISGWLGIEWLCNRDKDTLIAFIVSAVSPFAGFVCYAGVFTKFREFSGKFDSGFTLVTLSAQWFGSVFYDLIWLMPLALAGLLSKKTIRSHFAKLGVACLLVPLAAILLMPHAPFPRNFVPMLPLWLSVFAFFIAQGIAQILKWFKHEKISYTAFAIISVAVLVTGVLREQDNAKYAKRHTSESRPQGLYDVYYHNNFHPTLAIAAARELVISRKSGTVLIDKSDLWGLRHAYRMIKPVFRCYNGLGIAHGSKTYKEILEEKNRLVIIARSREEAKVILAHFNLKSRLLLCKCKDTGFFKIYATVPTGQQ